MSKYSDKWKWKVVQEYLEGPLGYKQLACKYGVPNKTSI
ncbi:IS3 family transposase [Salibacterium salarium]|uniref:IS3 family transposase n=1 Tax=Salibacterium salarium TaxID=284579 RepID=A0A428MUT4_9BACI|nr:IS3 family transposase [Salibacterium salarium]